MSRPSIKMLQVRRDARLKRLAGLGPFVAGSLVEIEHRCGKPGCRCAKGQRHRAYLLTTKVKGKTKSIYIPKDLLPEVRKWTQEYRRQKSLTREISKLGWAIIHSYVPTKRAAGRKSAKTRRR